MGMERSFVTKRAISKNVLGWSYLPIQQNNDQVDSDTNNIGESKIEDDQ